MCEWKEVWQVWDGVSIIENSIKVLTKKGRIEKVSPRDPGIGYYSADKDFYVAYSTGQNRRRVECDYCGGEGKITMVPDFGLAPHDCYLCTGKGYKWEYSK